MDREPELRAALEEATLQRERAEAQSLVLERITTGAPLKEVLELLVDPDLLVDRQGARDVRSGVAAPRCRPRDVPRQSRAARAVVGTPYRFLTTWLIEAPRQDVWNVLADVEAWPGWWPAVAAARELDPGDGRRVGSRYRVRWKAPVGYAVEFDFTVHQVDEPRRMAGRSSGDLEGAGVWRLFEENGVTAVTYEWQVITTKPWMKALGPLPRPLIRLSHHRVMSGGGEALKRLVA